ncbi:MAG TPA: sulfurtransferase complex subunit TusC [Gammaproteobacteria bacterium]|nr:sulfurtransferase complex subunit TusC [Gammaproteobacteria bacterium]
MKRFLLIMQQNPYANSLALEGLEFAMALSSFNQTVTLLFKGDGVLQLLAKQDPEKMVCKDFSKIYSGLSVFGIEDVYIDQNSMRNYDPNDLFLVPKIVDEHQIVNLIKDHDIVLTL